MHLSVCFNLSWRCQFSSCWSVYSLFSFPLSYGVKPLVPQDRAFSCCSHVPFEICEFDGLKLTLRLSLSLKKNESLRFEFRSHPGHCQLKIRLEMQRENEFKDSWRKPFCCLRCAVFFNMFQCADLKWLVLYCDRARPFVWPLVK